MVPLPHGRSGAAALATSGGNSISAALQHPAAWHSSANPPTTLTMHGPLPFRLEICSQAQASRRSSRVRLSSRSEVRCSSSTTAKMSRTTMSEARDRPAYSRTGTGWLVQAKGEACGAIFPLSFPMNRRRLMTNAPSALTPLLHRQRHHYDATTPRQLRPHWPPTYKHRAERGKMASAVSHLPNNAASWWFRDRGLRKLSLGILVGFLSSVNYGESGERSEQSVRTACVGESGTNQYF